MEAVNKNHASYHKQPSLNNPLSFQPFPLPSGTAAIAQALERSACQHRQLAACDGRVAAHLQTCADRVIRQLALHLWRRETSVPAGIAAKQKRAGWITTTW